MTKSDTHRRLNSQSKMSFVLKLQNVKKSISYSLNKENSKSVQPIYVRF